MKNKLRKIYYALLKERKKILDPITKKYTKAIESDLRLTANCLEQKGSKHHSSHEKVEKDGFLILSFSNLPFLIKAHCLLGRLALQNNYKPILLTYRGCKWAKKYAKHFGIRDILFWEEIQEKFYSNKHEEKKLLGENFTTQDIKKMRFKGVAIGKHAMSSIIRKSMMGRIDFGSDDMKIQIEQYLSEAIMAVDKASRIIEEYNVKKIFVRDAGYLPNGPIYETALERGIDAFRFESAQMLGEWQIKRYNKHTKGQALFSISPDTWDKIKEIPLNQYQLQLLGKDFQERYNPDSTRDLYKYQMNKQELLPEAVRKILGLDPSKKTAVIFSHISWDANFFDGEDLFDNFEHWLVETVKIACENPNLNWVVKLHPANVYKLARENKGQGISRETELDALEQLGDLPENIKIMQANNPINTWSLIAVTDYGLTVRGTIGMELPCFGIPVVTAGTGRYDHYGFTIDPGTREEYETCLKNLHKVENLDDQAINLAKKHAYWVFLNRTVNFNDVSTMTSDVLDDPNHPLHHNILLSNHFDRKIKNSKYLENFSDWLFNQNTSDYLNFP